MHRAGDQGQPDHRRRPRDRPRRRSWPRCASCSPTGRCRRRRSAPRWPSGSPTPATQLGQLARAASRRWSSCPPRGTLEGQRRRGLRVRRPLDRPAAGRARRRRRSCAATCARSARPPPPTSPPGRRSPGSARCSRRWTTWSRTRTRTARCSTTSPTAPIADEDAPAPVRLLGTYDNVWLSHAAPRPGHRPGGPERVDGRQRRRRATRSSSTAGSPASGGSIDGRVEVVATAAATADQAASESELDEEIARSRRLLALAHGRQRPWLSAQRGVRDSSAATAATPAVDVRSTSAPSRTATAPGRGERRDLVVGRARPRGRRRPRSGRRPGRRRRPSGAVASSCSTTARSAPATSATTSAVEASCGRPRGARTGAPAWPPRGRWRATSPATSRPARPSRPRRRARPPRARSAPRRSR